MHYQAEVQLFNVQHFAATDVAAAAAATAYETSNF